MELKKTYFDIGLPQVFVCEICRLVCKDPIKNLQSGFIFCQGCSYGNSTDISSYSALALRSIYLKCQQCDQYKKYLKYRDHQQKCQNYYQNYQKGKDRFDIQGLRPEDTMLIYSLIEKQLTEKSDIKDQEYSILNFQIFCKNTSCQQQLNLNQVKDHYKNCEFQFKVCQLCEKWSGFKRDFKIHKQMCYQNQQKVQEKILLLEMQQKQQEVKQRIIERSQVQMQSHLNRLLEMQEEQNL